MKLDINLKNFSKIAILTERKIAKLWLKKLRNNLQREADDIIIEGGEKSKTLETCE